MWQGWSGWMEKSILMARQISCTSECENRCQKFHSPTWWIRWFCGSPKNVGCCKLFKCDTITTTWANFIGPAVENDHGLAPGSEWQRVLDLCEDHQTTAECWLWAHVHWAHFRVSSLVFNVLRTELSLGRWWVWTKNILKVSSLFFAHFKIKITGNHAKAITF